jgi:thiamine-phosphate pyrophosphorylase
MIQIITHSAFLPGETGIWLQLLNAGADSILLRKPGWQESDYEQLFREADPACYNRLMIAGQPALCERYGLQGLHFSEAARSALTPELTGQYLQNGWRLSTGIHHAHTLQLVSNDWHQLFLSPVFDSISKPGYRAAYSPDFRLQKAGYTGRVLALGGIDHTTASMARTMQFDGIAILGAIWQQPENALQHFCKIRELWKSNVLTP